MHSLFTLRRRWYGLLVLVCAILWPGLSWAQYPGQIPDEIELQLLQQLFDATQGPRWHNNGGWPQTPAAWAAASVDDAQNWAGVQVSNGDITGLSLRSNNLSGSLPTGWHQLTELRTLDLSNNRLTGSLPDSLSPALTDLDLSYNQFVGSLPPAWGQLDQLQWLFLSGNQLSGALPAQWSQLSRLLFLALADNRLTGPLPTSWSQCNSLFFLDLSNNRLSGVLPATWSQFAQLRSCYLGQNRLSGTLPASFLRLLSNGNLNADDNRFTDVEAPGSNLVLDVTIAGNYLGYAALERLYQAPAQPRFSSLYVYNQLPPVATDTIRYVQGGSVTLHPFGEVGLHTYQYQWQREVAGQWVNMPGDTLLTKTFSQATAAVRGRYRLAWHNRWFTNRALGVDMLYSRIVYADLVPYAPLARNLPVDANRAEQLGAVLPAPDANASAPTDMNYVRTFVPRTAQTSAARVALAPVDSVSRSTRYLDGLGRPVQTVQWQASPQRRDLVQPQAYDELGREPRQYLPYAADTAGTGRLGYHAQPLAKQQSFYASLPPTGPVPLTDPTRGVARTSVGYSETLFEPSPLNRVVAQAAPGESWQLTSGHAQQRLERPNTLADSVLRFAPDDTPQSLDPGYQGYYAAGELWGTQTTDEHGNQTISWTDKLGQVVLKQVEAGFTYHVVSTPRGPMVEDGGTSPGPVAIGLSLERRSRWLRTAYAYDDFGLLRYVLQPEGTKRLRPLGNAPAALPVAAADYLFAYQYDGRGRMVAKRVPGQEGEVLLVFDRLDRPVLSQDAQQRTRREWQFTKYDALGRVVLTGLVTRVDTAGRVTLQNLANTSTTPTQQYEQRTASASYAQHYTTDQAFPRLGQQGFSAGQVLFATYYDDYDFDNNGTADVAYDTGLDTQFAAGSAPVVDALRTTGFVTRIQTRVMGVPTNDPVAASDAGAWLTSTTFYDERGRTIQVQGTNVRGGTDLVTSQLDFTGAPLRSVTRHTGPNHDPLVIVETMSYDHAGRLVATQQQLPGETQPTPIAQLQYNELSQVTRKTLGTGRLLQNVDYTYNIRGWLTSVNDPYQPDPADLFNLSLHYERGFSLGYGQYNGNLTGQTWRGRDGVQRAYGYVYDPLSRLLQGDFVARTNTSAAPSTGAWNQELDNYRLSFVSYDDNGNIKTLRRRGLLQHASRWQGKQYGPVDDLTYTYQGNRLLAVDDQVTGNQLVRPASYRGAPTSLAGDFQERGVRLGQEYFYDASGNMTQDKNKGITGITYNFLDQPTQIRFGMGADSIVFRYTGTGLKIAKLVYQTGKPVQRTDYLGPYQYEGDSLRFFPHAGGRVLRRVAKSPAGQAHVSYQREYTFSDHLGNLRLAYRGGEGRTYSATLEQDAATRQRETQQFDSLSVSPPIASYTGVARTGTYAARLNAGTPTPQPLGPLLQLAVQKGDTLNVTAYGLYPQAQQQSFWFSFVSFLTNLIGQQPPAPAGSDPGGGRRTLPLLQIGVNTGLASLTQLGGGVPKGYLRVLVFDKDSVLVNQYTRQLTAAAYQNYEPLQVQLVLPQDGYVTTYVGNESNVDVFFDDLLVEHRRGLQVQEMHYDPYGLNLAGLSQSSPGLRPLNKFTFNGVEFGDELGLGLHLTLFRLYDPQLGRFHQVDPLADFTPDCSPFAFADGNPVANSDPDGLAADGPGPLLKLWRAVKETALAAAGFTKHGDYNAGGRGGKGNVYHTFLGHTHHSQGGGGIKPLKPRMATLDAPPLGSPPVPDMQTVPVPPFTPVPPHIAHEHREFIPKSKPIIFHGETIDIKNKRGGTPRDFNEDIRFAPNTTSFLNADAVGHIQELAKFLKEHSQLSVIITVNTASDGPWGKNIYGPASSPAVANMRVPVNGSRGTEIQLLQGRAQAIVNALSQNGISSSRVKTVLGGHWSVLKMRRATINFQHK